LTSDKHLIHRVVGTGMRQAVGNGPSLRLLLQDYQKEAQTAPHRQGLEVICILSLEPSDKVSPHSGVDYESLWLI
jgi:hypothetical protein